MANITFRKHLIRSIENFCSNSNLALASPKILADLIARLSHYEEEGIKLSPQVYLTDNIDSLIRTLPEGERLRLSTTTPDESGIEEVIKICAPIATGDWRVFCNHIQDSMEFGVFRGSSNPSAVNVDDVVLSSGGTHVVKVHRVANSCVEILSSSRDHDRIFFDHRTQDSTPPLQYVDDLIKAITKGVEEHYRESAQELMKRVITSYLHRSHGCLCAVVAQPAIPPFLSKDSIVLEDPISFLEMIRQLGVENGRVDSILSKSDLAKGMLGSDGITLFDDHARLLAYRCFIPTSDELDVVGGARTRVFETLKNHLGKGILAVFMQSQDGHTDFDA